MFQARQTAGVWDRALAAQDAKIAAVLARQAALSSKGTVGLEPAFSAASEGKDKAARPRTSLGKRPKTPEKPAYRTCLGGGEARQAASRSTAWNLDERLGGPVSCGETDGVFPCRLRIRHGARPCPPAPATPTPLRPTSARSVPARTCLATACACS